MGLIDLKTDLKSLRFGKDVIGGGNSNQPYVVTKIPEGFSGVGRTGGPDFLLRGGTLLPRAVVQDVSRLTKMFFDFRSPSGPLFVVKQNVLSLTNVNSSAGYVVWEAATRNRSGNFFQRAGSAISTFLRNNVAINQGIYTPLSTLGQAVGSPLGVHLNKQGINPLRNTTKGSLDGNTPLGLPTYLNTIASGGTEGNKSRLVGLTGKITENTQGNQLLYKYTGGPGAILGVGTTSIMMLGDQRTGRNNKDANQLLFTKLDNTKIGADGKLQYKGSEYSPGLNKSKDITGTADINATSNIKLAYGASIKYFSTLSSTDGSNTYLNNPGFFNGADVVSPLSPSVYQSGDGLVTDLGALTSGAGAKITRLTYTQEEINATEPLSKSGLTNPTNFSDEVLIKNPGAAQFIPKTINYATQNIEQRVNLGNPGKRGNLSSYVVGKREFGTATSLLTENDIIANSGYKNAADKINAFPLYRSSNVTTDNDKNDLVKFRIGVIDSDNPTKKTFIHFRAYIDSFSDNFSADWSSQKYMGRGENFYKYNGFDREISLSWTVAAQSKQELIPMHQKLNYLASVCAPDYSPAGYMRGNLISLTIGGWCYEQIGIMKGLNLEIPNDSPWEIGIPDSLVGGVLGSDEEGTAIQTDSSVKELPMIIKVSGFSFIPIHKFVPRVQQNKFDNGQLVAGGGNFIEAYGPEHYIALAGAGGYSNYGTNTGLIEKNNINYTPTSIRTAEVDAEFAEINRQING
jgi:hypothetical protein